LYKLLGEAIADLDIQDRAVMLSPVGCAVFGYYYVDCGNVQTAHGRAPAVGTAIARLARDSIVISYQGDGDLASIGLAETLHAANRGERMAIFFVNNAVYAMTGGQLAPTTLIGQRTTTSPDGRSARMDGFPLHMCELVDQLAAPVYIERCSLADARRIRRARAAVRRALEIQKQRKGFAFVEFLSPCPTNMHCGGTEAANFVTQQMEPEFPLKRFRDCSSEAVPEPIRDFKYGREDLEAALQDYDSGVGGPVPAPDVPEVRIRLAGFGGQGVLSLGTMLAHAGQMARRFVTWFPSYGPEQRGGTASCSVVLSGQPIGTPVFTQSDILVALNGPALEKFGVLVPRDGLVLYDAKAAADYTSPTGAKCIPVPALELAAKSGTPRAANTAMLGALAGLGCLRLPESSLTESIALTLAGKPKLIPANRHAFAAAAAWVRERCAQPA
jgi:2-oxoisovalerate ferredoxin oxidoreductase beta subunit